VAARQNVSSGRPWESLVGYSRAVRVGNLVFVSGTAGTDDSGNVVTPGDPYRQSVQALRIIEAALQELGLSLRHVIRTRIFVTDISRWQEVARAHAEVFGEIRPATTMVEVSRLLTPEMVVEIEADAVAE
jgi:enamine deaminase RidA (YjgF/YER057c/UK114 family)